MPAADYPKHLENLCHSATVMTLPDPYWQKSPENGSVAGLVVAQKVY